MKEYHMSLIGFRNILKRLYRSRGRVAFMEIVPVQGKVLDVGCGNNSAARIISQRPDINYIGLDICDHNQSSSSHDNTAEYIVSTPEDFAQEIEKYSGQLDAVVSSHNLEHCNDPDAVLHAISHSLKVGGKLYLSFPCEESVNFPHREGTLNYYDDRTHKTILNYEKICTFLEVHGLQIVFASKRYRPMIPFLIGLLFEPISYLRKKVTSATWALYGFESVIWANKAGR